MLNAACAFSMEACLAGEYVRHRHGADAYLGLLWRTPATCMLGRNQIAERELDFDRLAASRIALVRRPSGGGTIYTDPGCVQYSFLQPFRLGDDRDRARGRMLRPLLAALQNLQLPVETCGRNDLEACGHKVAGFAEYVSDGVLCTHCSILMDADLTALGGVLRPDPDKYRSKALPSVRARVANLLDIAAERGVLIARGRFFDELAEALRAQLECDPELQPLREVQLQPGDHACIEQQAGLVWGSDEWTRGRTPPFDFEHSRRFPAGRLTVQACVRQGRIAEIALRGDFLSLRPTEELEAALRGVDWSVAAVMGAVEAFAAGDVTPWLGGLGAGELVDVLFGKDRDDATDAA